jgi:pyruvate formate lyase activating enzyme
MSHPEIVVSGAAPVAADRNAAATAGPEAVARAAEAPVAVPGAAATPGAPGTPDAPDTPDAPGAPGAPAPPVVLQGTPTTHWSRLPDGRVQCDVCPRECRLRPGQRGLCFVRGAGADGVVLTGWGRASGFCIDPIEKKPLAHFLPGTAVLSFGTAGCNLACDFCQNWDISKTREMERLMDAADPQRIAEAALRAGARSVAFTYNDPVIFLEYALDVARECRARGLRTVAVTAGYVKPAARAEFFAEMDAANVDLKAFTERFYRERTKSALQPVLDTLVYLARETRTWLEITTLLIPGENDSDEELDAMTRWLAENVGVHVPLHFSAFRPEYRMQSTPATPHATLARARTIALRNGLRHVYVGNVRDPQRQATYCPCCGEPAIGRDWHAITSWRISGEGRCASCGTPIPGVFEARPGAWGRKRVPIRLAREAKGAVATREPPPPASA